DDGMMERFDMKSVFCMHNLPGLRVGQVAIRQPGVVAATAEFAVTVTGKGGHPALPHTAVDPIVTTAQIILGLQTIASRSVDPTDAVVVSVTRIAAGDSHNIIPECVELVGTVRTLRNEVAALAEERMRAICTNIAAAH